MKVLHSFRLKLVLHMVLMAMLLVGVLGTLQYVSQFNVLEKNEEQTQLLLEKKTVEAVQYLDNYFELYRSSIEHEMRSAIGEMDYAYKKGKGIEKIDLVELKKEYGLDFYIISRDQIIVRATDPSDIGLDFKELKTISPLITKIFNGKAFVMDGLSITLRSRSLRIFAYQPTADGKYLLEAGMNMEDRDQQILSKKYISDELGKIEVSSPSIESINILFPRGVSLNKRSGNKYYTIKKEAIPTFRKAIKTREKQVFMEKMGGHTYTYVYLPFRFRSYAREGSDIAVEIKFNSYNFDKAIAGTRKINQVMIVFAFFLSVGMALFVSRIVSEPISAMTEEIKEISAGNIVHLEVPETKDEFQTLGNSFNDMVDRIKGLLDTLQGNYLSTVKALANAIEASDTYTKGHCERVTQIGLEIAKQMGLSDQQLIDIEFAGLLHDIGKIGIPGTVLNKEGSLTEEEREMVCQHPEIGYRILEGVEFLGESRTILRQHHERVDGKGYPAGLIREKIRMESRILAVADAYDAMTSARPYRKAPLSEAQAFEELKKHSGLQFDETVVQAFMKIKENG